jgi:broad specificity phosphatase PhoE
MKIIIVRHGETVENKKGIIAGQMHGHLSKRGLNEAKELAKELKEEKIDIIISSPLKRAKDTAKIISKSHPGVPLKFANELKEMNFGKIQGKTLEELGIGMKDIFWLSPKYGGESIRQVYTRAKNFLKEIKKIYSKKKILIVGHATINRALVCAIKKVPASRALKIIANPDYIVKGVFRLQD